jgi:uncharacterized protein (TIGR02271 family)
MNMEKRIVGSFNSEQEVLHAIEELKRQGHRETDIMVVAKNRSAIPLVTSRTGVMVEAGLQMSTLAGVMMDSFVTMMTAGMGGRQVNTLSGNLIERGLSDFTAKQCEEEVNKGKIILLVDTNKAHDNTIQRVQYEVENSKAVPLREEQLDVIKQRVQVGELQLRKKVIEEQRTVHVPVMREEVYVERIPVVDGQYDSRPFTTDTEDEIIRIPITEERIEVTKRPVVVEEVIVGKQKIQEIKQVQDTIKKEEAQIEHAGPPAIEAVQERNTLENSDILVVEGNPDLASIMEEDQKNENREKRVGSVALQGDKNQPEASINKNDKANNTLTDSSAAKESENPVPVAAAAAVKAEAAQNNKNSSVEAENKNNKNQMKKTKNTNSQ